MFPGELLNIMTNGKEMIIPCNILNCQTPPGVLNTPRVMVPIAPTLVKNQGSREPGKNVPSIAHGDLTGLCKGMGPHQ